MSSYYLNMSHSRLRDILDQLEERLIDLAYDEPDNFSERRQLEDLINNLCELLWEKEKMPAI